jgi:ATP-grasp domain
MWRSVMARPFTCVPSEPTTSRRFARFSRRSPRTRSGSASVEEVLLRVGAMVEAHPEIAELDCNPVIVGPDGAVIVDARPRGGNRSSAAAAGADGVAPGSSRSRWITDDDRALPRLQVRSMRVGLVM